MGLQLPTREVPIITPSGGPLRTSNLKENQGAKVALHWARGRGWEVGKQAEAGLGACVGTVLLKVAWGQGWGCQPCGVLG